MAVNFPTNRQEAGLSPGGALIQGDIWRYHSIEYTWVVAPDGTGYWSSKGININPDLYIAKSEVFEANGGTISGNYAGTSPFAVGHATSSDSATALETARTIGGVSFDGTSNINLPGVNSPGNQNTTGNAATATSADKVDHSLTLTFVDVNNNSTSIVYDGSSAKSMTFTDTDVAQDVITISGGGGIDVTGTDIAIDNTVARVLPNDTEYIYNGSGLALKVKDADSVGGIPSGDLLQTSNTTLAKIKTDGAPTTSTGGYVVTSNGNNGLKVVEADRASKDESGKDLINSEELASAIENASIGDDTGSGTTSGRLEYDLRNYSDFVDENDNYWDRAFEECINDHKVVYIPAGVWSFEGDVGIHNSSARVYGDGSGLTTINFVDGGLNFLARHNILDINQNSKLPFFETIQISGITIRGRGNNAVKIEYTDNGYVTESVYMDDVTVQGMFDVGFNLINTDMSVFERLSATYLSGRNGSSSSSTIGVKVTADPSTVTTVDLSRFPLNGDGDPVNIKFNNCSMSNLGTGFTVDSESEGVYIIDSLCISTVNGILIDGNTSGSVGAAEPYFVVRGCNLDVENLCIELKDCMQSIITDCSFYKRTGHQGNWQGIHIKGNSFDNIITDNVFNGNHDPVINSYTFTGIYLTASTNTSFSNNRFINLDRAFYSDQGQVSFNEFIENTYRVVTTRFAGSQLQLNNNDLSLLNSANKVVETFKNSASTVNEYQIKAGQGLKVFDFNNPNGFTVTPGGGSSGGNSSVYPGTNVFTVSLIGNFTTNLTNAINSAISSGGHVFIPAGDHTLSDHIVTDNATKKHQVSIFGAGAYSTEIKTNGYRIVFRHPVNIRDMAFVNGSEANKGTPSVVPPVTAMLNFYRQGLPSGVTMSMDDMDSSMIDCHIQGPNFGYAIAHRGRNFKFHNNRVIKASGGSPGPDGALYLDYANAEVTGIQGALGWRRLSIVGNTFHSWKDATCITFGFSAGSVPCYGALISDNTVDHGGQFLLTTGVSTTNLLTCCNISDNAMHYISNNDSPVINIGAINSSITNNPVCRRGAGASITVNGENDTNGTGNNDNIINNPTPLVRN